MTKEIKKLVTQLRKSKEIIAAQRDIMRNIIEEYQQFIEDWSIALEDFESGLDKISEKL